jgi:alkylation response protein AidB-like acyl-CoA dehydrogenase
MAVLTETRKGGSWLLDERAADVFTPEQLSEEHRLIAKTARDFAEGDVLPRLDELEAKDWDLARQLVARCGELGLMATDVPEAYGGLDLDKVSSLLVAEGLARSASFCTTFGAQTGLAIVPLLCFGTEAQKAQYLPGLVSGERVGAYALSESGSGSDALGARAKAVRLADGSYALTGEKMWITNCGFADVFIVFAKVDGEAFTAFIVERGFPGVSHGREEHKMGLHGSSTAPLILQDARVPAANVLGEIGKGHKVAFNVLNYGRFKLGAMTSGGAKAAIAEAARYAATRRQFGRPIAEFGAIRYKLSEMTIRLFAVESLLYRTAGLIDRAIAGYEGPGGAGSGAATLAALEEYAVESSIAKVAGSEMLDYVLDENVQIHGGNGYVRDYPAERHYRDARVNRIFEGTNEINRMLLVGMLMRRAVKGDLALIPAAKRLQDEILSPSLDAPGDDPLEAEAFAVTGFRKTALMLLGSAMQQYGDKVSEEQEVLSWTADVLIETYAAESAVRRAQAALDRRAPTAALQVSAARVLVCDGAARVEAAARQALAAMAEGDQLRITLAALRRLVKVTPVNSVVLRRAIAARVVETGSYPFA